MQKSKAKFVETKDNDGGYNGYLIELKKDGDKTEAYLTACIPGCFKGYHLHKVRESNYVCTQGVVKIITYTKDGREETLLSVGDKMNIPTNVPTGLQNDFEVQGVLINFPDPAYDPLLTDEQVDYTEEEVLAWVEEQNAGNKHHI